MNKKMDMGINMYDFNRINMKQFPYLETEEEIENVKTLLRNYINKTCSEFYMLLNHDVRDFTLFNFKNGILTDIKIHTMANDIIECFENRAYGLLDVELDEAGLAVEIWVKDRATEEVYMFLLFPYDSGVIQY